MSQLDLIVDLYSDKAIVVRGEDTKSVKGDLLSMGGKYNSRLRDGPGWIFPKYREKELQRYIETGEITQTQTKHYGSSQSTDQLSKLLEMVAEIKANQAKILKALKISPVKILKNGESKAKESKAKSKNSKTEEPELVISDEDSDVPRPRLLY